MTDPLLEVRDLTAAYGPVQVLFGLDLVVNPGEFVVMLGANGAGKTTTLRALSGLVSAHGTMNFDGSSILGDRAVCGHHFDAEVVVVVLERCAHHRAGVG